MRLPVLLDAIGLIIAGTGVIGGCVVLGLAFLGKV